MNISVGGVIEIQAKTASSCGSEIYCACIHKGINTENLE